MWCGRSSAAVLVEPGNVIWHEGELVRKFVVWFVHSKIKYSSCRNRAKALQDVTVTKVFLKKGARIMLLVEAVSCRYYRHVYKTKKKRFSVSLLNLKEFGKIWKLYSVQQWPTEFSLHLLLWYRCMQCRNAWMYWSLSKLQHQRFFYKVKQYLQNQIYFN